MPTIFDERKEAQNYHRTSYPVCMNCKHCESRSTTLPDPKPGRKPLTVHLKPLCTLGGFKVMVSATCDLFEYRNKFIKSQNRAAKRMDGNPTRTE